MTSLWCLEFLLCLQLLHRAYSEEPQPVFRVQGSNIDMGYCFGVEYIVVYRSAPGGDKLLGNSSDNSTAVPPPADLLGRFRLNQDNQLLGLQIRNVTHMDSGIYRQECWQNQKLVGQITKQLSVCDEEVKSEEIIVTEGAAGVELLCNSPSTGLEGTSVHWYHEMPPSYKTILFLDSGASLEPVVEEMKGLVEVRDRGARLVIDKSLLKSSQDFHCLVIKGKKCLSFQDMFFPDHSKSGDIYVSLGDRVVLKCPSDGKNQQWDTPLGMINSSRTRNSEMYVSAADRSQDFSLVIPAVTDEHVGDFSCVSTSHELQYFLILCPKEKRQEKMDFGGRNSSLECNVSQGDSEKVLWYRAETSGEYELILDSDDKTAPRLEDLKGRVTLSDNGSSLIISGVQMSDAGVYWCVVLGGPEFLEPDDDYDEDTEDDEYGEDELWHSPHTCISKQEIILTLIKPVTPNPKNRKLDANPAADPPPASNVPAYAAGAGAAALLVVGAIAAAILIRKKMAKSRSGINKEREIKMTEDPGCTRSLTGDECGA